MSRETYPGGLPALLSRYEARREPFSYAPGEGLPAADMDLAPLTRHSVADPAHDPSEAPPFRSSYHRKRFTLRQELQGRSEAAYLHAILIAHLRKRRPPASAAALFLRLWAEQAPHLLSELDARWLVSAVTTFGDHGETPAQRSTGLALTALFGTMKLYESERLYSGHPPERAFTLDGKARCPLPLQMDSYSLVSGGLDVNLVARLWQEAASDAVIAPLAHDLLTRLITEETGLLHRLSIMRARKQKRLAPASKPKSADNPAPVPARHMRLAAQDLRWGVVSTIKAPLPQIARFAAYHLEQGADALHIFLDQPNAGIAAFLSRHPKIHVTECNDAYWAAQKRPRPDAHQPRQSRNATNCMRAQAQTLDWLCHIDVDEFLIAPGPIPEMLARVPSDSAFLRAAPAEALARPDARPEAFKLSHADAGQAKAVLQDIYPTFGLHLYGGFLSHTSGKIFVRTGIPDTRFSIHTLKYHGQNATNRARQPGLYVAHLHAPSWEHFNAHLAFRRTRGSYRKRSSRREMGQAELLQFLCNEEGEDALRAFFDEVCSDTPPLRARLAAHNMLVEHPLNLDATVARVFGDVPEIGP